VRLERADSKSLDGVPRFIIGRNGEWPLSLDFAPRGETAARAEPRERWAARDNGGHGKSGLEGTLPPYPQLEYS
jgi:hypothetical protein